jgi:hypothetical protein
MNPITGRTEIELGGEVRVIAADMNAMAVLFEQHGEHFALWLLERFTGKPVELPGGGKGRRLERVSPDDLASTLYALLATDREKAGRIETKVDVASMVSLVRFESLQAEVAKCVLVSWGIPGEAFEAVAGAGDVPRQRRRAGTDGIGSQS